MSKNPFGKTRKESEPYAIYKNFQGWTWKVLKTYKKPENEKKDQYARWFVSATSPLMQGGGFEMGDTYAREIKANAYLAECTQEWRDAYGGKQIDSLYDILSAKPQINA
jgi:hypothetical protein